MKRTGQREPAVMEALEERTLFDGNVAVEAIAGALIIRGDHADNAIIIDETDEGSYRILGDDATRINGAGGVVIDKRILNVRIDMSSGDDRVCIGNPRGFGVGFAGDVDVNMGAGRNELFLGRIADETGIYYAGPVSIAGDLNVCHEGNGFGSVVLAGLHAEHVNVDLGDGFGEKWFVLEDSVPVYLPHLRGTFEDNPYSSSRISGMVTVNNPAGPTHVLIGACTVDGRMLITTGDDADTVDVLSARLDGGLRVETNGGADTVCIGYPFDWGEPVDPTNIFKLTLYTGHGDDDVYLANLGVWDRTTVVLGAADTCEELWVADRGYFCTNDLRIESEGTAHIHLGRPTGPTHLLSIVGDLSIYTSEHAVNDDTVDIRGARVEGESDISTGGGHDVINIGDSTFVDCAAIWCCEGDDIVYIGNVTASQSGMIGGTVTYRTGLRVFGDEGTDNVSLQGATVEDCAIFDLGAVGSRVQGLVLGSSHGGFSAGNLRIRADGRSNIMIGEIEAGVPVVGMPVAWIDGDLDIRLTSAGNDWVLVRNTFVGGDANVQTGDGWDVVSFDYVGVGGNTTIDTGAGRDLVAVLSSIFLGSCSFATGPGDDGMYVRWCMFAGDTCLDGGDGMDYINADFRTANILVDLTSGPVLFSAGRFERTW